MGCLLVVCVRVCVCHYACVSETYSCPLLQRFFFTVRFQRDGVLTRFLPTRARGVLPEEESDVILSAEVEPSGVTTIVAAQALELDMIFLHLHSR